MVSVPTRQNHILEPHGDRAAVGADGEEAARPQYKRDRYQRAVFRATAAARADAEGAAAKGVVVLVLSRGRRCVACDRILVSVKYASVRHRSYRLRSAM